MDESNPKSIPDDPLVANPYNAPMAELVSPPPYINPENEGDATGGVIPYKNPHALIAYYLGIVSLLPVIGVPFGVASVTLGCMGLSRRKRNPVIKGSAHAWIGIILGSLSLLCGAGIVVAIIASSVG